MFSFFFIYVSCLSWLYCLVSSLRPCDHLLGKGGPLGSLTGDVSLCFVTFLYGVSGQVRHFIVSLPDHCLLLFFYILTAVKLMICTHFIAWCKQIIHSATQNVFADNVKRYVDIFAQVIVTDRRVFYLKCIRNMEHLKDNIFQHCTKDVVGDRLVL